MERNVLLLLRPAVKTDFSTEAGEKKIGVAYFEQQIDGIITPVINYFTNETDMFRFKSLYAVGRIYVMVNPNEPRSLFNCIDWDLVERELDFEKKQLSNIYTKYGYENPTGN